MRPHNVEDWSRTLAAPVVDLPGVFAYRVRSTSSVCEVVSRLRDMVRAGPVRDIDAAFARAESGLSQAYYLLADVHDELRRDAG